MIATKEWVKSLLSKLLKQNDIYSYTERRIGTWVDGKPLYRKIINFGALPNKAQKNVAHGISNVGMFVTIMGAAYRTSDKVGINIPYVSATSATNIIQIIISGNNITISSGYDASSFTSSYVILEYTKTTD